MTALVTKLKDASTYESFSQQVLGTQGVQHVRNFQGVSTKWQGVRYELWKLHLKNMKIVGEIRKCWKCESNCRDVMTLSLNNLKMLRNIKDTKKMQYKYIAQGTYKNKVRKVFQ